MDHTRLLEILIEAEPGDVEILLHFLRRPLDRWEDIARRLGVSPSTVWRHVVAQRAPEVRRLLELRRRHICRRGPDGRFLPAPSEGENPPKGGRGGVL